MLKSRTVVESSWGTSRICGKTTWHQDNDENRECCNLKGQSTSNNDLSQFRMMRANMWCLEGGIQGRERKGRRKVAQDWESSVFQEKQRENAPQHWLLYLTKQYPLPLPFPFHLILLSAILYQMWNTHLHVSSWVANVWLHGDTWNQLIVIWGLFPLYKGWLL